MASYDAGKKEVCEWIRKTLPKDATVLDVGACDGKWKSLLWDYKNMDAVEAFEPNITAHYLRNKYRNVYHADIVGFEYERYDLVIFGDILEHLTPDEARRVLEYAKPRADEIIIGVPWLYPQEAIYGNPYEIHKQPDLTPEIFEQRYGRWQVLIAPKNDYCYFIKEGSKK